MRMVLSEEGEAMKRPQGDQAMRPIVPACPRQMHRSLIPGTGSSPTFTPSAESTFGCRVRVVVFFFTALRGGVFLTGFFFAVVFRVVFFFAMVSPIDQTQETRSEISRHALVSGSDGNLAPSG